jgi:excisionase family DNA binding protein
LREKDFYTLDEASEILRVSQDSILKWVKDGLPFTRINNRILFLRENLLEWTQGMDKRSKDS